MVFPPNCLCCVLASIAGMDTNADLCFTGKKPAPLQYQDSEDGRGRGPGWVKCGEKRGLHVAQDGIQLCPAYREEFSAAVMWVESPSLISPPESASGSRCRGGLKLQIKGKLRPCRAVCVQPSRSRGTWPPPIKIKK